MEGGWLSFFTAAFSGGMAAKFIDILYHEIRSRTQKKNTAKSVVDKHLDPLLKAADEIVGKTRSLAERDFKELITSSERGLNKESVTFEILGFSFLYAQFWARVEILRTDSLGVSLNSDKRGKVLKEFLACLESQRIRLVDRLHQKAIGEFAMRRDENGRYQSIRLIDYTSGLANNVQMEEWARPLLELFMGIRQKKLRQRVLVYGTVMHAMIDTLDPAHHSTHMRSGYCNKLSKRSRNDIKYRVFGTYLKEVRNTKKYVGK